MGSRAPHQRDLPWFWYTLRVNPETVGEIQVLERALAGRRERLRREKRRGEGSEHRRSVSVSEETVFF